ncbi:nucleotidyltransferase domain-containing protein [Candidatus Woesearchaeota archaeon]|nr:nucleotidyltransferase domain-containing protein [Candidatus Woesearchaeota archaeon]
MRSLTKKERETLIILFKDFTSFYNANSISKVLNISHVGAQKIFKRLLQENLVVNKTIGKSITYKLNFNENYVSQLIVFLLVDEANNFKRWREEFKEIFKKNRIVLLFGSTVKDYTHAKDIDLIIIIKNREVKEINAFIKKKEEILPKKIHAIKLTASDLQESIKKKDNAMVDIIKNAIILYGQDEYVKMLKNAKNYGF